MNLEKIRHKQLYTRGLWHLFMFCHTILANIRNAKLSTVYCEQGSESKQYNPPWLLIYYNISFFHKQIQCNRTF